MSRWVVSVSKVLSFLDDVKPVNRLFTRTVSVRDGDVSKVRSLFLLVYSLFPFKVPPPSWTAFVNGLSPNPLSRSPLEKISLSENSTLNFALILSRSVSRFSSSKVLCFSSLHMGHFCCRPHFRFFDVASQVSSLFPQVIPT